MHRAACLLALSAFAPCAIAQTSFPMITHAHPVAVQRGMTAEVLVEGTQNFAAAYGVLFESVGVKVDVVPSSANPAKNVKLKVAVGKDAPLGVREFRIATNLGISSVGQLLIVDDPVVLEGAKNNTFAEAQAIRLPAVVAGKLEALEDVDYYKFEAKEGEHVTFELQCARMQDKIHDLQKHAKPQLSLFDAEGRELAANDHFYFADPMLSYTIAKSGTYYIQVRESTYEGDPRWVYALLATNKPYASHVFPLAGNPGKTIEVAPIGTAGKAKPKVGLKAPETVGIHQVQLDVDGVMTYPVTFIVSDLPQYVESGKNQSPESASKVSIPVGINGRIAERREMDHYVFAGKKGQSLRMELKARRFGTLLNSSLHGVIEVFNAKGVPVAVNDTSHGQEASLVYKVPADGDYTVRIRDLNSKGGPSFVYYLEIDEARPDFTVRVDPDKAMIGPGSSAAWYVQVARLNGFAGPVEVEVRGLPEGMNASPLTIAPSMTQGLIVLTASPDAKPNASMVQLVGKGVVRDKDGKDETLVRTVQPIQEIYNPGGGRARFDVNMQAAAVTGPSDIQRVDVSTQSITIKQGEEVKIDVSLLRRPDYDKGVTLDVALAHLGQVFNNPLPTGVTVVTGKSKTLLGTTSKGHIVLKAAPNAEPVENVPISVVANVSINFVVKVAYSSPPILVTVLKK
jgi:hypothetical protein